MKKIQIIKNVSIFVAALLIVLFWVAGLTNHPTLSMWGIVGAGASSWIAVIAIVIEHFGKRI